MNAAMIEQSTKTSLVSDDARTNIVAATRNGLLKNCIVESGVSHAPRSHKSFCSAAPTFRTEIAAHAPRYARIP